VGPLLAWERFRKSGTSSRTRSCPSVAAVARLRHALITWVAAGSLFRGDLGGASSALVQYHSGVAPQCRKSQAVATRRTSSAVAAASFRVFVALSLPLRSSSFRSPSTLPVPLHLRAPPPRSHLPTFLLGEPLSPTHEPLLPLRQPRGRRRCPL